MLEEIFEKRLEFKKSLQERKKLFGGWVSFAHPSISEIFAQAGFDFIAIDMEHSTISVEQAQRIIATCQGDGTLCLPRPVSHSNDWIKPLLDSGADGLIVQMVNTPQEVENIIQHVKFPPIGSRSYGVNRAHNYGLNFDDYIKKWNESSSVIIQVESIEAVENIEKLLEFDEVDGVMIGPYDISGSLGVPGQTSHQLVIDATRKVIEACQKFGKSCGTQIENPTDENVKANFDFGYTFVILGSDLFILSAWVKKVQDLLDSKT
jgi:2-dehydro-3-deoxyglucarate aldolase